MFSQENITNEDDVMMLSISNQDELLFAEIDTIPNEYDEEVQEELFKIFDRREYKTRLYLASRNELDGQLRNYDFESQKESHFDQNISQIEKRKFEQDMRNSSTRNIWIPQISIHFQDL